MALATAPGGPSLPQDWADELERRTKAAALQRQGAPNSHAQART
jgi:hypothetical protein